MRVWSPFFVFGACGNYTVRSLSSQILFNLTKRNACICFGIREFDSFKNKAVTKKIILVVAALIFNFL